MTPDLAVAISTELRDFVVATGTRRALPTTCHVGHAGGEQVGLPDVDDQSLRTDLVARAIEGLLETPGACAWMTRGGDTGFTDADAAWFAAARQGFGRHGLALPAFVVMTRNAWVDLVSGEARAWQRIRVRRGDG